MNKIINNKGFTLIELLAVIVVLALVAVIGTTQILPLLGNAKQTAFATEANEVKESASLAMSLIQIGSIDSSKLTTGADYNKVSGTENDKYCFSMAKLVELGVLKKDSKAVTGNDPEYAGTVIVTVPKDFGGYNYATELHNKNYYVIQPSGDVNSEDVQSWPADGVNLRTSCANLS